VRLQSLELSGFRGFARQQTFDLDADAVVVIGANGQGKTSLFDAILWALSGRIPRLHNDDVRLVSMYSEAGQARVELRLKDPATSSQYKVIRSYDKKERRVALETPNGLYQGPAAEGQLIDLMWPEAAAASDPQEALASVLTRSIYLQQDLIRQFIEAATDQERFAAVSELVGAGRVTELQSSLERAKKAWSTATNQRQDELRQVRARLGAIEVRLSELKSRASQAAPPITPDHWAQWWQSLEGLGLAALRVEAASRDAPTAIDDAIKRLDALRRSTERRLLALRVVQVDIAQLSKRVVPELVSVRDHATALRKELENLKRVVSEEQVRLAEQRHLLAALKEKTEQLKTLAALALKHLEDRCPVCAQAYDKESTRLRLEVLAAGGNGDSGLSSTPDKLPKALDDLAAKEKEVAAAELALRSSEQAVNERQAAQQSINKRLADLEVQIGDETGPGAAVEKAIAEADGLIRRVIQLQRIGESLALGLARTSAVAAIDEFDGEAGTLRRESTDREKVVAARNKTGEKAQQVIEALREAASVVVEERLREIGPLLQSIYARIDCHPSFRLVAFLSQVVRGKGQLSTVVRDPIEEKECDVPSAVLSSSQVNALAASVFLALNVGVPRPPLDVAILDDPLQSLDDINLLGLVDLLRRVKDRRQLCVSTHDGRFGSLLSRKFRPRNEKGRTVVIELDGWSRSGPVVQMREVKNDPVRLRLIASRAS
jgi:DNA repair exonuclease SbcCD ATPase subunit